MNLSGITEVRKFRYEPGDRFILHVGYEVDQAMADDIKSRFITALQLPEGTPVAVLGSGWNLAIAGPTGMDGRPTAGARGHGAGNEGCLNCDYFFTDEEEACICSARCDHPNCRA